MKKRIASFVTMAFAVALFSVPAMAGGKGNDGLDPGHGGGGCGNSDTNRDGVSGANGNQGNDKPVGNAGAENPE